ncbi:unnamed protein product [Durusdinium trenchii]|uniref:Uncharacterized protein n=1 Tax=Durusdinium trenchii TaxID=1381693 RepID=A0ABP0I5K7_9DINO
MLCCKARTPLNSLKRYETVIINRNIMQHHETFTDGPRGRAFFDEALRLSLVDRPSASIEADVVEAPEVLRARERSSRAKMKVERSVEPVEKVRRRLRHKQPCEAYGAGVFKRRRFS